ncbi:MAG: hypothetical protein KDK12_15725 [Rhodobacteraceae bacterium]|nr:hypothetical protein [Paracoccaceae bacterium]
MARSDLEHPGARPPRSRQGALAALVGLGAAFALGSQAFEALDIGDPASVLARLVAVLGLAGGLALLLERAVAVLLTLLCGPAEVAGKARAQARRDAQAASLSQETAMLDALESPEERLAFLTGGESAARLNALDRAATAVAQQNADESARHTINKQYLSTLFLVLLGGALAMGGFRILSQVFGAAIVAGVPWLGALDVVVTTLVLGGGAQGIHDVITKLTRSA